MADDERLREALLELQLLREREAQTLAETKILLDCVEAYSLAPTPEAALTSIFGSLTEMVGAEHSALLHLPDDGPAEVVASDLPDWVGKQVKAPLALDRRARNLTDFRQIGAWEGTLPLDRFTSMLLVPFAASTGAGYVMMSLAEGQGAFAKDALKLAERVTGLAVQAVIAKDLAAENTLLAAAIAGSSSGFAISDATDPTQPLVYVNRAFERLSGFRAEEVLGQNCRFLSAEAEDAPERTRLRETVARNGPGRFLLRNRRKSGEMFWNELTLFPVRDAEGAVRNLVATQNDVSERIDAEQERDRLRTRLEQSLEATDDAFLILDADRTVVFANDATRRFFPAPPVAWSTGSGFAENWAAYLTAAEATEGRITSLFRNPDPDGLADHGQARELDLPGGRSVFLRSAHLDAGGLVLSATDISPMKTAQRLLSQRLAAIEAARDGIAIADEDDRLIYLNSAAAGLLGFATPDQAIALKWRRRYLEDDTAVEGPDGLVLSRLEEDRLRTHEITLSDLADGGSVIVFRDVTDRVETEARESTLKVALLRAQRQQAVAKLAAGIAHDFNNLLSAINGSATLISMEKDLSDTLRGHAERITSAGTRAGRLVNRLLDMGSQSGDQGTFALQTALNDLPELVTPSLPEQVTLSTEISSDPLLVRGDPGELSQAVVNLVFNAIDAIGAKPGQITVRAAAFRARSSQPLAAGILRSGGRFARIDVVDTGKGMTPDTMSQVFTPYFTTKGRQGTGLGLAMVAMQAQGVGGSVDLTSTRGEGTTVTIYWPLASDPARPGTPAEPGASHDLSGMTIIVVDDEAEVAEVLQSYLERFGAEVSICTDPHDALEAVEESPAAWSAVITDYDMPGMTGGDLTEQLRGAAPDLPIFLVTALARRLSDARVTGGQVQGIFAKPLDLDRLCRSLSDHARPPP